MIKCPKCNSWQISGPRYRKDSFECESLEYTCNGCGYRENRPTADQIAPADRATS